MTIEGSKEAFDALIASNSGDVNALTALDEQLKKSNAPWARLLRIRIIDLRRKLPAYRSEAPPTTTRIAHAPNNPWVWRGTNKSARVVVSDNFTKSP